MAPWHSVLYRISKEKALVHHIINRSATLLPPGAKLTLVGHKREGLLSYGKRARGYLNGASEQIRGDKGYTALTLERAAQLGEPLPDDNYPALRPCIAALEHHPTFRLTIPRCTRRRISPPYHACRHRRNSSNSNNQQQ